MRSGWIKLHRKILNHWIYTEPLYFRAWVYCLLRANHEKKTVMIRGELIEIDRGEFVTSLNNFHKDTELSVQQIRTFFKLLQNDKMIRKNPTRQATKITICKYDSYNDAQHSKQQTDNTVPTHGQQQTRTNKNEKNKLYGYFEFFWNEYHKISGLPKTERERSKEIWIQLTKEERLSATDKIKPYVNSCNPKYIKKARTYLSDKNFNDEFEMHGGIHIPIIGN